MNRHSAMAVCEAEDGQVVIPGHAYIAPGDRHLLLVRDGARYVCRLSDGPPENRHRPSVDAMFHSIARHASVNVVGALLTGMGEDGARGLKELLDAGARTLVQDEASCIVYGMPGAAVKYGAAQEIVELNRIAERLLALSSQQVEPRASSAGA
jgi:two-component system chemotaxis response regulator CheB